MIPERRTECIGLLQRKDYDRAFRIIFEVLGTPSDDEETHKLVWLALSTGRMNIPPGILNDSRLDPFLCHCDRCGAWWIPLGVATAALYGPSLGGYTAINPVGLKCQSCGGVFCRKCFSAASTDPVCPKCGSAEMEPPMEANGRGPKDNADRHMWKAHCNLCGRDFTFGVNDMTEPNAVEEAIALENGFDIRHIGVLRCSHCSSVKLFCRQKMKVLISFRPGEAPSEDHPDHGRADSRKWWQFWK